MSSYLGTGQGNHHYTEENSKNLCAPCGLCGDRNSSFEPLSHFAKPF